MYDINLNIINKGDIVYALTTPHSGSKSKRLFRSIVEEILSDNKVQVMCFENKRKVNVTSKSIVKPAS